MLTTLTHDVITLFERRVADAASETDSFHPSMWEEEREHRQQIKFDFAGLSERELSRLKRTPTPYPKEMKHRVQHMRNLALKQANVPNGEAKGGTGPSMSLPRTNQEQYERVSANPRILLLTANVHNHKHPEITNSSINCSDFVKYFVLLLLPARSTAGAHLLARKPHTKCPGS